MRIFCLAASALLFVCSSCKKEPGAGTAASVEEAGYELTQEAFFRAAESDDTKALGAMLTSGMEVGVSDPSGRSALHAAAGSGALKSVDFLLDRGIPVDVVDQSGRTPLMEAVIRSDPKVVRHLLTQGANPRVKDNEKYKPLMLAVRESRAEMVSKLAPYVREELDDALLVAAILGRPTVIDELTNYGASVYARLDDGRTPLMLAAQNGRDEAADMLLAIGANRFGMDEQGRTAADLAREAGHDALADRLAGEPLAGDFELMPPAELGAEMVTVFQEGLAEEAPNGPVDVAGAEESSNAGATDVPPLGEEPGSATLREVSSLEGAVVGAASSEAAVDGSTGSVSSSPVAGGEGEAIGVAATPEVPIVMRSYREKELPLRVDSTTKDAVTLTVAGGKPVTVAEGASVPGSTLEVVRISRRVESGKNDGGEPVEVSVVVVRDSGSGVERDLIVGLPALAHDPVALVEDSASGRYFVARTGQRFRSAAGEDFLVGDVRPNQVVIENLKTGETTTLPLRGPRG